MLHALMTRPDDVAAPPGPPESPERYSPDVCDLVWPLWCDY